MYLILFPVGPQCASSPSPTDMSSSGSSGQVEGRVKKHEETNFYRARGSCPPSASPLHIPYWCLLWTSTIGGPGLRQILTVQIFLLPSLNLQKGNVLHVSVILSRPTPMGYACWDTHTSPGQTPVRQTPPGRHHLTQFEPSTPRQTSPQPTPHGQTPPSPTATATDGTHPTGMHSCCWLIRGSLFIELGCPGDLGKGWRGDLGTFMISRPI